MEEKHEVRFKPATLEAVDGLVITSFFQLGDGRMEVNWEPVNRDIPAEFDYLAKKVPILVAKTRRQAGENEDLVHYLFTDVGEWRGIRCPSVVWKLFMQAKGVTEDQAESLLKEWALSPTKTFQVQ